MTEKQEAFYGYLTSRLINVWGTKKPFVRSGTPATDGKTVTLPLDREWVYIRTCAEHESGHLRYSDFRAFKEAIEKLSAKTGHDFNTTHAVLNILEDFRVEYLISRIFPGTYFDFKAKHREALSKITNPDALDRVYTGIFGSTLDPVIMEARNTILKYLTFASVVKSAKLILQTLPRNPPPPSFKLDPVPASSDSKLADEEETNIVDKENDTTLLSKFKDKIEKSLEEKREKKTEKDIKDPFYASKLKDEKKTSYVPIPQFITRLQDLERYNLSAASAGKIYTDVMNKNMGLINTLSKYLSEIHGCKDKITTTSGKLNINRAISYIASQGRGTLNIFTKSIPLRGLDILLLVDQSGSMRWHDKIESVRESTIIFSRAVTSIPNTRLAILGFHTYLRPPDLRYRFYNTYCYKNFDEKLDFRPAMMQANGCNRDGYHIRFATNYLLKHGRPDVKKALIILSDGLPNDEGTYYVGDAAVADTKKAYNQVKAKGLLCLPLGFGIESGLETRWESIYADQGVIVKDLKTALIKTAFMLQRYVLTT